MILALWFYSAKLKISISFIKLLNYDMVNPIHFINVNYECYYFSKELTNVISHS